MPCVGTATVPTASGTIESLEFEVLGVDPDVAELIAAVDAILSAAMTTACRLPAPPVTGYHFPRPGRLDSPAARRSAPRRAPVRPVQAMQRSPPVPDRLATKVPIRLKGR